MWHDEWMNERIVFMLNELRRMNCNIEKNHVELKAELEELQSNLKRTREAVTVMRGCNCNGFYQIICYIIVGFVLLKLYSGNFG